MTIERKEENFTCYRCKGTGKVKEKKCGLCDGTGIYKESTYYFIDEKKKIAIQGDTLK